MRFLSMVGNSFGCSASGERLVSAARDGDLQEAKALLECNPRLARYSTFGVQNSPLHCSAARGHHEIVFLLLESGVDINLRNTRGQTALMQACLHGHWEAVQILMLFRANIHKTDYINGGTAIHFAALNGNTRCIRLLVANYIPSVPDFWYIMTNRSNHHASHVDFDDMYLCNLFRVINKRADGGITALHMAALNGHAETAHLLLDLGASVSALTVEDGTTIDLVGSGSTPLHYAACGGNLQCCQLFLARGASWDAVNANGWTPLMVARLWHRNRIEGLLSGPPEGRPCCHPSPYLSIPLMSIMSIARECGLTNIDQSPACIDPCSVCLESKCTVFAEGCQHEFCTSCALYLCSTARSMTTSNPPGSIPCPLCRYPIISFEKLACTSPIKERPRSSLSLSMCAVGTSSTPESETLTMQSCNPDFSRDRMPPSGISSFRSLSCHTFCMGPPQTSPSLVSCSRTRIQRSASQGDGHRRCSSFSLCVTAAGS